MKINNLNIIANYLFDNPHARYTDVTRHLCFEKGRVWNRGKYSRYFSKTFWKEDTEYANRLWAKSESGGWVLTALGMGYVTKHLKKS